MQFIVEDKVLDLGLKIKSFKIENIDNKTLSEDFLKWREEKVTKLYKEYQDYDTKQDNIIEGFYTLHQKVNIPRRKNLPSGENLIKMLEKKEDIPHINKAVDIYNIISVESKLCLGAHDIDKVSGNITLRLTKGTEKFIPLGDTTPKEVKEDIYSFIDDDNEIICYSDIRQVDKTKVTEDTKNIIYLVIGNENTSDEYLTKVCEEIINTTLKFCHGEYKILR